jgi:hypothetical protein
VLASRRTLAKLERVRSQKNSCTESSTNQILTCASNGSQLILQAVNDFDSNGSAFVDDFSDAISAGIKHGFDGDGQILSIHELNS